MTEQERIDLLKEVVRVAPEELNPRWSGPAVAPSQLSLLNGRGERQWLCLDVDADDASAIILMLDAIERDGWRVVLEREWLTDQATGKSVRGKSWCHLTSPTEVDTTHEGETRAEAVARAFVETFESRVVEDGFGGAWQKCDKPDCDLYVVRPGKVQCSCEGV